MVFTRTDLPRPLASCHRKLSYGHCSSPLVRPARRGIRKVYQRRTLACLITVTGRVDAMGE